MSLTNTRRLKGAFVYFIPFGETVDGSTVSKTSWPDATPTSNWEDWAFGCIENVQPIREADTETLLCPDPEGGYVEEEEMRSKRDGWTMQTNQYNELITQLEYGLKSSPVAGTPQTPFAQKNREINGVVLIQARGQGGSDFHIEQWEADLKLDTVPEWANSTSKPTISFRVRQNDLNTFEIPA